MMCAGKSTKRMIFLCLALALGFAPLCGATAARGAAVLPGERLHLRMVAPVENSSGFRVWGGKYYPGDVLAEKMTDYFYRRMKEIPLIEVSRVEGSWPAAWRTDGFSPLDMIVRINLEDFRFKKTDTLGSKVKWDVFLHMYVYNGATKEQVFDSVIEERDERLYPLYNDTLETGPVYWEQFAKSPYWPAICRALDLALDEVVDGYNGYRVVGRIAAKAERVDGSLSVPKKERDKLWHITLGRNDSVRMNDVLIVTRASSVRTIAPETPEMHFPQVVGRVKVIFLKGEDAVVRVVKESKEGPIQLGDAVSIPLAPPRNRSYF